MSLPNSTSQKFSSGDAFNYVSSNVRRIIIGLNPL